MPSLNAPSPVTSSWLDARVSDENPKTALNERKRFFVRYYNIAPTFRRPNLFLKISFLWVHLFCVCGRGAYLPFSALCHCLAAGTRSFLLGKNVRVRACMLPLGARLRVPPDRRARPDGRIGKRYFETPPATPPRDYGYVSFQHHLELPLDLFPSRCLPNNSGNMELRKYFSFGEVT